jgi:CubicO group peptidase (beta-lactamase class C family)
MMMSKVDIFLQALTELNKFSGSVLIAKGDAVLLNKGYGLASQEFEVANTSHTRFRICSITEMLTATGILHFQEKGLLSVQDTLQKFFPHFERGSEITIHHVLSHTSGIVNVAFPFEMKVLPTTLEEIVAFISKQPLDYEPGAEHRYSNSGYCLFAAIIEQVSGKTYELFIKETILEPLDMHESFFPDYPYTILKNTASGYCLNEAQQCVKGPQFYESFGANSSGGLFCTAHDLYCFARALSSGKLLSKDSMKAMFTPYHDIQEYWSNGYGCCVKQVMGKTCVEHFGSYASGFKTNVSMFLDDEVYIVLLSNFFSTDVHEIRNTLVAMLLE